ncbi:hypothetical protein BDZ89DRAFT_60078 [Hymenopellis radicata]|nr:hypothetical protein BDZ89DRAFT_60078 [Hymenopellis radicata]
MPNFGQYLWRADDAPGRGRSDAERVTVVAKTPLQASRPLPWQTLASDTDSLQIRGSAIFAPGRQGKWHSGREENPIQSCVAGRGGGRDDMRCRGASSTSSFDAANAACGSGLTRLCYAVIQPIRRWAKVGGRASCLRCWPLLLVDVSSRSMRLVAQSSWCRDAPIS